MAEAVSDLLCSTTFGIGFPRPLDGSTQVLSSQASEFKHGDFVFAHDRLEFGIAQDIALVGRVLQVVGLDVFPQLFDNFGARQWSGANDGGQFSAGFQDFGECGLFFRGSGHGC